MYETIFGRGSAVQVRLRDEGSACEGVHSTKSLRYSVIEISAVLTEMKGASDNDIVKNGLVIKAHRIQKLQLEREHYSYP
jgi:hypothetical protein